MSVVHSKENIQTIKTRGAIHNRVVTLLPT